MDKMWLFQNQSEILLYGLGNFGDYFHINEQQMCESVNLWGPVKKY